MRFDAVAIHLFPTRDRRRIEVGGGRDVLAEVAVAVLTPDQHRGIEHVLRLADVGARDVLDAQPYAPVV